MLIQVDPLQVLRDRVKALGSQRELADELDYTQAYISDIMNGRRNVSDELLEKLGLRRVVVKGK